MERKLLEAASKLPDTNLSLADVQSSAPVRKCQHLWHRVAAVAACFCLLAGIGFGSYAYAAEAREYDAAISFFGEYDLSTKGLTRGDIKSVYRDIKHKAFAYEKTAEVITNSLTPEQRIEYEEIEGGSTSGDVADLWEYKTQNTGSQPTVETTQPTQPARPTVPVGGTAQRDGLTFQVLANRPNGYTVTKCEQKITGEVMIPDDVDGYPVVAIGPNAFERCTSLLYLSVGKNVSAIFADFASCWALKRIKVAAENPYYTSDEYGALYNKEKTVLLSLPCNSGSTYIVPDSVTTLNANAFGQYNKMASLTLGKNVERIDSAIFQFCHKLKEITVAEGNTCFETDEYGALYDIRESKYKKLIRVPTHLTGNYTVRKGTKRIGAYAFDSLFKLESIIIPESVTSLGQHFVGSISTFKTIYFGGTAAEWVDMVRASQSNYLLDDYLTMVFNYTEKTLPTTAEPTENQPTAPTQAAQNTAGNQSGTVIAMGIVIVILALLNIVTTVMLLKKRKV